jgi:C1A family cysteine protease
MDFAYGWNVAKEDHAQLMATQQRFDLSHYMAYKIPRQVDQRKHVRIKNQQQVGACSGFSRSTIQETLHGILTKWKIPVNLSANFAYITNQQRCGCTGGDKGATISGSAIAAKQDGICLESMAPFRGVYDPNISGQSRQFARQHTVQSHSVISSYRAAIQYLGTVGCIQIGMPVGNGFQSCKGPLTTQMIRRDVQSPEGGHALAIVGYLLPQTIGIETREEDPWLLGVNSWTEEFGDNGFFYVEPEGADLLLSMISHGEVECVGMSKQETFKGDDNNSIDFDDETILC